MGTEHEETLRQVLRTQEGLERRFQDLVGLQKELLDLVKETLEEEREYMRWRYVDPCVDEAVRKRDPGFQGGDIADQLRQIQDAIGLMRTAAWFLERVTSQDAASYHTHAGLSSAGSALEATAIWLRLELRLEVSSVEVDLRRLEYRRKVVEQAPRLDSHMAAFGHLANAIDAWTGKHLLILKFDGQDRPRGWYFSVRKRDHIANLFREWAGTIEKNVCGVAKLLERKDTGTP